MSKTFLYDWGGLNVWLFHGVNDVHSPLLNAFKQLGTQLDGWMLSWLKLYLDFPRPPLALPRGEVIVAGFLSSLLLELLVRFLLKRWV